MSHRRPRVLAVSPPRPGPWIHELGMLADAGVDALLVRIFDDPAATEQAARTAQDHLPLVLLRWLGPASTALATERGLGLHLPAHRPPHPVAGPLLTSTSCHELARVADAAQAGVDMVTLSPIFPPGSKPGDTRPALGTAVLGKRPGGVWVLALGGMDPPRARAAVAAGADGVAGIGAFFAAGRVRPRSARALVQAVAAARRGS